MFLVFDLRVLVLACLTYNTLKYRGAHSCVHLKQRMGGVVDLIQVFVCRISLVSLRRFHPKFSYVLILKGDTLELHMCLSLLFKLQVQPWRTVSFIF